VGFEDGIEDGICVGSIVGFKLGRKVGLPLLIMMSVWVYRVYKVVFGLSWVGRLKIDKRIKNIQLDNERSASIKTKQIKE